MGFPFTKMHGLGNDFVIIDVRERLVSLAPATLRAIADRHNGVGCDQIITLERANGGHEAEIRMRIHNADGHEVEACGNATRCVADMIFRASGSSRVGIETTAGLLMATAVEDGISVDMGPVKCAWNEIPLSHDVDTCHLPLSAGPLRDAVAVNIGNPHAVFFVADALQVPLAEFGPQLETDPLFPDRANIGAAQLTAAGRLRLRVWERGVGLTRACGTGACAAVVAASRRGLVERRAEVELDGGVLQIEWRPDGHVVMTGPTAISFTGNIDDSLLQPAS